MSGRTILWYCLADDSWGGCNEDAMLIVYGDDLTPDEHAAYLDADHDDEVWRVLVNASNRIDAERMTDEDYGVPV